ncbi:MAG TPA: 2-hydroxyacyl-CoA dehydratase family protein [Anaeromyxobacteraceae bacterium]|nr:2-hydroxyacyl-CoA dehydratase family protein [Anaeromyxobacteraceae bacterium]
MSVTVQGPVVQLSRRREHHEVSQVDWLKSRTGSPAVDRIFELALSYIQRADEAHRQGRKVVYGGGMTDAPIIHATDTFPCVFPELGRLASDGSVALAEDHFRIARETCSMVKATMGELLKRKGLFKRLINYCSLCEPYNAAFEVLKEEGYDIYSVDLPYRSEGVTGQRFEHLVDFAEKELRGLATWLGGRYDEARLGAEIRRLNRLHAKVRRVLALQVAHPDYIGTLETLFVWNGANHNYGVPGEYEALLDQLIDELEAYARRGIESTRVPIVWAGGRGQEFGLYKLFDDLGGFISSWTMTGLLLRDYDEGLSPLRAVARNTVIGMGGPGGSKDQLPHLEEAVRRTGSKGIIFYGYFGCSFSSVNFEVLKKHFNALGIPSLILDGSFQTGDPSGQNVTRLKAFMEMVQ